MEKTAMMKQVDSVPDLWAQIAQELREKSAEMAQILLKESINQIILIGCGDSLGAAVAARQMFMQCTNVPVQVLTAIDVARHYPIKQLTGSTLTIAVSNSGNVSRVIEAAKRITQNGGKVLALTSKQTSTLAQNASFVFDMNIPKFHCSGPGMRSYSVALLALYELAIAYGVAAKSLALQGAEELHKGMDEIPKQIENYLPKWHAGASEIAQKLAQASSYEFLGSGADYATAWFSYAKELEVAAKPASALSTEDWAHMNYFVRDVGKTATFMFVNETSPAKSRTDEVLKMAAEMNRPVVCVCAKNSSCLSANNIIHIETPIVKEDVFQPLVQYLPVSLVLAHIGVLLKEVDFRGTVEHWTACINFASIADSEIEIVK